MTQPDIVLPLLEAMSRSDEKSRLAAFRTLFWTELNYERADQSIPTASWMDHQKAGLLDLSVFATYESQFGRFDLIYGRLDKLSRVTERDIITKLLASYPYALFVFSDQTRETWHFVNVKYAKDASARRLFRRITVGANEQHRTASQRIALLDVSTFAPDMFGISPLTIQERHDQAFDVEAVTRAFYRDYEAVFAQAEKQIQGLATEDRRLFTQRLFNRLMFIRFLERKGWLTFGNSRDYLQSLWKDYTRKKRPGDTFYASRLIPLFLAGLNNSDEVDIIGINQGVFLKDVIGQVPYLNGGLFEEMESDRVGTVPDDVLGPVVDGEDGLFYRFNFTVTESTPFDVEVAVDPEMLGKIFEELVTGRHESGSYYTPKAIVSFMGREAIRNYLQVQCPQEKADTISAFIDHQDATQLTDPESILNALKRITICDPACGSGAYLLGMMQELLELRRNLFAARHLDAIGVFRRKLEIIQSNLYGVDIDLFAVNITRLRLWLSLIVDFEGDKPLPLPNLDYKVEVGNSLIAPDPSGGLQPNIFRAEQIKKYLDLKNRYLDVHGEEKKTLHAQVEAQRHEIREWMKEDRKLQNIDGFDWAVEFTEVFTRDKQSGGFDVIVANPPYVRQELIKDQKPALKVVFGANFSGTADLFVYFYFRALQLLRKNGVMTFISSNKWLRAGYGEKLRDYLHNETTIESLVDFGDLPVFGAIAYPAIVVARKAYPPTDHRLKAINIDDMAVIDQLVYEVDTHGWQQPQDSLNKKGWALMNTDLLALLEEVKNSGKPLGEYVNSAMYRGVTTGFNEAFVIDRATRDRLIAEDPKSAEIIKPYLRGRDVKRWQISSADLYLIFTRRGIDLNNYKAIKTHLTQFQSKLTPGIPGGRKSGPYEWHEIQDNIAYYPEFEKPKIIWAKYGILPAFTYDRSNFYCGNTVFILPSDQMWLIGLLNSRTVQFYAKNVFNVVQNGYIEWIPTNVTQIPIPNAPTPLKTQIETIVRSLLDAKGEGPQVVTLEAELNALVYQAYGLTATEIHTLENYLSTKELEIRVVTALESISKLKDLSKADED